MHGGLVEPPDTMCSLQCWYSEKPVWRKEEGTEMLNGDPFGLFSRGQEEATKDSITEFFLVFW